MSPCVCVCVCTCARVCWLHCLWLTSTGVAIENDSHWPSVERCWYWQRSDQCVKKPRLDLGLNYVLLSFSVSILHAAVENCLFQLSASVWMGLCTETSQLWMWTIRTAGKTDLIWKDVWIVAFYFNAFLHTVVKVKVQIRRKLSLYIGYNSLCILYYYYVETTFEKGTCVVQTDLK